MAMIGFFGSAQRSLIFQPTRTGPLLAKSHSTSATPIEDVELAVSSELTLHGWLFRSTARVETGRQFLVIYFGGNGGCRGHRITDCSDLTRLGCEVVLFDYRGYGDNAGSPTENLIADDSKKIWKFAHEKLGYASNRIVIFGESLGGAVATRLASDQSIAGDPPAALILNSTFSSLVDTAKWHYPFLPVKLLLIDQFPSVDRIPKVTCPILQFHGTADTIVPYEQGQRLFQAAPKQSTSGIEKQFVTVEGGNHNEIGVAQMQSVIQAMLDRIE
jgi:fermentation-respiration switch protein FrsA (DUF1100 family)